MQSSLAGTDALLELLVESGVLVAPTKPGPVVVFDSFSAKDSSFASSDSSLDSEAIARNKRRAKKKEREAERRLEKIDAACCFRLESNPIRD